MLFRDSTVLLQVFRVQRPENTPPITLPYFYRNH